MNSRQKRAMAAKLHNEKLLLERQWVDNNIKAAELMDKAVVPKDNRQVMFKGRLYPTED